MCSESSSPLVTSPRISFSHDLDNGDDVATTPPEKPENDEAETESTEDLNANLFDFSFSDAFVIESSSADELFSDGLILPIQLQEKFVVSKHDTFSFTDEDLVNDTKSSTNLQVSSDGLIRPDQEKSEVSILPFGMNVSKHVMLSSGMNVSKHDTVLSSLASPDTTECSKQENPSSSKEVIVSSNVIESEQKHQSKSFWRIDRSSSVHCDDNSKKSSFWSLPLISRSNSTGSVPTTSRQTLKENKRQSSHKQSRSSSSSSSNHSSFYMYQLSQKPPLKKNHAGAYGNGVWVNPAMNAPPPYIAKGTANLFGLTSLFREKKDKKNKK